MTIIAESKFIDKYMANYPENSLEYYQENGYCIIRNLIPESDIEDFLTKINSNLYSNKQIEFPRMDTQDFGKVHLSKFGYLTNPIADIHLLKYVDESLTDTWDAALKILTNTNMLDSINQLTNAKSQSLVMSMFFDQNAGTPIHQDCYYLDSLPPRNLTAAWIALEDISEKAGRFYIAPKTHNIFLDLSDDEIRNSNLYEQKVREYVEKNQIMLSAPILHKGDVLFWNSGTMHGSHKTGCESHSRKSFTCHFVPDHCKYVQNQYLPKIRDISGFTYNNTLCRITNSLSKEKINNELIPRSTDTFLR